MQVLKYLQPIAYLKINCYKQMENTLTIMVPVDFTPVSYKALEFAASLLNRVPVQLHLVHVVQVSEADWACNNGSSETLDKAAIQKQVQTAEQQLDEIKGQAAGNIATKVVFGGLTTALVAYTQQHSIDMVVMGTAGAAGWQERISGSTAQHVARYAEVPLITIHEHASVTPIENLLMVADFREKQHDTKGLHMLKMLQELFGAQLHLLQIIDHEDAHVAEHLLADMQQFAKAHQLQNYELHLHNDSKIHKGVRKFNEATIMDLVCVGTHAHKGISQLFYGSIAETLVNRCIRPLLTYHI
jgi:nucleotide-binding universal stress UspA family protein